MDGWMNELKWANCTSVNLHIHCNVREFCTFVSLLGVMKMKYQLDTLSDRINYSIWYRNFLRGCLCRPTNPRHCSGKHAVEFAVITQLYLISTVNVSANNQNMLSILCILALSSCLLVWSLPTRACGCLWILVCFAVAFKTKEGAQKDASRA